MGKEGLDGQYLAAESRVVLPEVRGKSILQEIHEERKLKFQSIGLQN